MKHAHLDWDIIQHLVWGKIGEESGGEIKDFACALRAYTVEIESEKKVEWGEWSACVVLCARCPYLFILGRPPHRCACGLDLGSYLTNRIACNCL